MLGGLGYTRNLIQGLLVQLPASFLYPFAISFAVGYAYSFPWSNICILRLLFPTLDGHVVNLSSKFFVNFSTSQLIGLTYRFNSFFPLSWFLFLGAFSSRKEALKGLVLYIDETL